MVQLRCKFIEAGTTRFRGARVFGHARIEGYVNIDDGNGVNGWMAGPYDPTATDRLRRNLSAALGCDAEFSAYSLSQARLLSGRVREILGGFGRCKGNPDTQTNCFVVVTFGGAPALSGRLVSS